MDRTKIPLPTSVAVAVCCLYVSAALLATRVVLGLFGSFDFASPEARWIGMILGLAFGPTPAIVASVVLRRGREWAPVVVTTAACWTGFLLTAAGPVWLVLGLTATISSIVAVWTPSSRQFGRDVRAREISGLK